MKFLSAALAILSSTASTLAGSLYSKHPTVNVVSSNYSSYLTGYLSPNSNCCGQLINLWNFNLLKQLCVTIIVRKSEVAAAGGFNTPAAPPM